MVKPFTDADGDRHAVGEEWQFLGSGFSRFDDELSLCIRRDDGTRWLIPLIWKSDKQQQIIEHCQEYFSSAPGPDEPSA